MDSDSLPTPKGYSTLIAYNGTPVQDHNPSQCYSYAIHEAMPELASNDPLFHEIEQLHRRVIEPITKVMQEVETEDREIKYLYKELTRVTTIKHSDTLTVGLVGDAGVGKSSFVNALLGQDDLTLVGDDGKAVTQITQSFHDSTTAHRHHPRRHRAPSNNYLNYHNPSEKDVKSEEDVEDETEDRSEDYGPLAQTAEDYFLSILGPQAPFRDSTTLQGALVNPKAADHAGTLLQLLDATSELLRIHGFKNDDRGIEFSASKMSELQYQLRPYNKAADLDAEDRTAALWPLVDHVRIFLSSPLLRQGLIVADVPGLSDTNDDRRRWVERYLQKCSIVIIAGRISRIIDDQAVDKYMRSAIRKRSEKELHKIMLVPTRADDINNDPSKLEAQDQADLNRLKEELVVAERRSHVADEVLRSGHAGGPTSDALNEFISASNAKTDAEAAVSRKRILIRNKQVTKALQDRHKEVFPPNEKLQVVAVSSRIHQMHMAGKTRPKPELSVTEDGFQAIRERLTQMAHSGRVETLTRQVKITSKVPINRLLLLLEKSHLERKPEVLKVVQDRHKVCTEDLDTYILQVRDAVKDEALDPMKRLFKSELQLWSRDISRVIASWEGLYKAATFRAFCNHQGIHKPKAKEKNIDLMDDVFKTLRRDMDAMSVKLAATVQGLERSLVDKMDDYLQDISDNLHSNDAIGGIDMETFWSQFRLRRGMFNGDVQQSVRKLAIELKEIMSNDDGNDAVHEAMTPVWKSCLELKTGRKGQQVSYAFNKAGKMTKRSAKGLKPTGNITQQRLAVLRSSLLSTASAAPLPSLVADVEERAGEAIKTWGEELYPLFQRPFDEIMADLNLRFSGQRLGDAERSKIRERLMAIMPQVKADQKRSEAKVDELNAIADALKRRSHAVGHEQSADRMEM